MGLNVAGRRAGTATSSSGGPPPSPARESLITPFRGGRLWRCSCRVSQRTSGWLSSEHEWRGWKGPAVFQERREARWPQSPGAVQSACSALVPFATCQGGHWLPGSSDTPPPVGFWGSLVLVLCLPAGLDLRQAQVIALTSGTKCINGEYINDQGLVVNDCHAEVVARRAFAHFLYSQLELHLR